MHLARKTNPLSGLAILAAFGLSACPTQADSVPTSVITTIDFPGATLTKGIALNDVGDMAGLINDPNGATRGYERHANGTFSGALVAPGDNQSYTRALGINNAGTIVGDYLNIDSNNIQGYHGYLLKGSAYTTFDIGSTVSTTVAGINNAGDFTGSFGSNSQTDQGFIDVGGKLTKFAGPSGNLATDPLGINSSDVVVGQYIDSNNVVHGFSRNPTSGVITTIDVPNSILTSANGINDAGVIVGFFQDTDGVNHGYFDKAGVITTFDVAGALFTTIRGINNEGVIVGVYQDTNGVTHGYLYTPPSHTHLLWTNTNGAASLWTVASGGTYTSHQYGPYSGWTARALSDSAAGITHILWTNTNGQASLWNVSANGSFTSHTFGPYAGWTAVSVSDGPDGKQHLLWDNTNGAASLWSLNSATGAFTSKTYGPYAGWTTKVAVTGGNNFTDLLWTKTDGSASVWSINPSTGSYTSPTYGPYAGWSAKAISAGPDSVAHPLWVKTNGQVDVWDETPTTYKDHLYGPISGLSVTGMATGLNGVTHLLWNSPGAQATVWDFAPGYVSYTSHSFGPFAGWTAVAISAGP